VNTLLRDEQQRPIGFAAISSDLSKKLSADELVRMVVESTPNALVMVDTTGGIIFANAQTEKYFGYARNKLTGKQVEVLVPERFRASLGHDLRECLKASQQTPKGAATELFGRGKDGAEFPVEMGWTHMHIRGKQYLLVSIVDISERKRSEDALRKSQRQLRRLTAHLLTIREEERKRIAQAIHDELGQELTALRADLTFLSNQLLKSDEAFNKQKLLGEMQLIMNIADQLTTTVRRIATELRPDILDKLGLLEALQWQANEFEKHSRIKCTVKTPRQKVALDDTQATYLFRIFQESLTNVARHAGATRVGVELALQKGNFKLEIHDNGIGIRDDDFAHTEHLGLLGIRERTFSLGGEVELSGSKGQGTTLRVIIPQKRKGESSL
jgi:hypothetical protein